MEVSGAFSDAEGDALTYTYAAVSSAPAVVSASISRVDADADAALGGHGDDHGDGDRRGRLEHERVADVHGDSDRTARRWRWAGWRTTRSTCRTACSRWTCPARSASFCGVSGTTTAVVVGSTTLQERRDRLRDARRGARAREIEPHIRPVRPKRGLARSFCSARRSHLTVSHRWRGRRLLLRGAPGKQHGDGFPWRQRYSGRRSVCRVIAPRVTGSQVCDRGVPLTEYVQLLE